VVAKSLVWPDGFHEQPVVTCGRYERVKDLMNFNFWGGRKITLSYKVFCIHNSSEPLFEASHVNIYRFAEMLVATSSNRKS
jgi:hypothetical protein